MEHYILIKQIHITTAILSLLGFCLRAWWMITNNKLLQNKLVKVLPHINDTLLLSAAIYLSVVSEIYPFIVGWLGAKVVLLVVYIVAGTIALKRGETPKVRVWAFIIAVLSIVSIFWLAVFKPML